MQILGVERGAGDGGAAAPTVTISTSCSASSRSSDRAGRAGAPSPNSLAAGNAGVARIPGKHGQDKRFSQLVVLVDDTPGELARLLTEIGETGVNLEDLRLEHSPGAQVGLAEISVLPEVEQRLVTELESRGWKIAEAWQ